MSTTLILGHGDEIRAVDIGYGLRCEARKCDAEATVAYDSTFGGDRLAESNALCETHAKVWLLGRGIVAEDGLPTNTLPPTWFAQTN